MPSLIVAPQAPGLAAVPYLTVAEYRAAPTDVDLTSLVPGGSQQQQDDMLATLIGQASSWMDGYVHYQLGATIDTEVRARVMVGRDGYVRVPVRGIPVLEVISFSVGLVPSQLQAITDGADAWVQDNVIAVPVALSTTLPVRTSLITAGDRVFCSWAYVNGYPNTLLASTAHANDTSLSLRSALGIYAGSSLVIYDSGRTETVTVASSYVSSTAPGTVSVPLAAPLAYDHLTVAVSVSALPARAKKAAILATSAMIKVRGSAGLVMESIDAHAVKQATDEGGAVADLAMAEMQLQPLVLPTFF
jgi:hypothetical protein